MSDATIELVKNYDERKMHWPAGFQEKFDGVPVRITRCDQVTNGKPGQFLVESRQGKPIKSIGHILPYVQHLCLVPGAMIIGELYIDGLPFKDIGGIVRTQEMTKDTQRLVLHVFDADLLNKPETDWQTRRMQFKIALENLCLVTGKAKEDIPVKAIPTIIVCTPEEVADAVGTLRAGAEGAVLHHLSKPFEPGKRLWTTQRIKAVPTIDVRIVDFDEAHDTAGNGLNMVGRLNGEFHRFVQGQPPITIKTGIGPGALTHPERKTLWAMQQLGKWKPRIAEVRYMHDETYEALRQPTFKHWRKDKEVADCL